MHTMTNHSGHKCGNNSVQPPTHFIGIGGARLSALARILADAGCEVQGSDRSESPAVESLRKRGIPVYIGHDAANIGHVHRVVYTRAVPPDNQELVAAHKRGLPVIEGAELLGQLYDLFEKRLSVTGAHGKTSTSSMLAGILTGCGLDPTVLIGGETEAIGGNARLGKSPMIVAEACEAYASFLHLRSSLAIVTNVDVDHLDFYKDFSGVKRAFVTFLNQVDKDGVVIACAENEPLMSLRDQVSRKWLVYGWGADADYRITSRNATPDGQYFSMEWGSGSLDFHLLVPGEHFVLNAAGAIAAALESGCRPEAVREALRQYTGVKRRLELIGRASGITVVDDYAHHPTEIRATLKAMREHYEGRLVVVFQPHLYSRTREHLEGFACELSNADKIVLTDVYPAREKPEQGVESDALADALRRIGHKDVNYVPERHDVPYWLEDRLEVGDIVLTVGAGNIDEAGRKLIQLLKSRKTIT